MKNLLFITIYFFSSCFFLQAQEAEKNIQAGNDLYKKLQYEKAIKEYEKIPQDDSSYAIAQFNLGNTLYRLGKKEETVKIFNTLLENEKNAVQASKLYYNNGVVLGSQQKLEESIDAYKNALRRNPDDKDARENLQKALQELKRKNPPPKTEDKKKKPQQSKLNPKEAAQRLKQLEQKEKNVQQKMQSSKTQTGSQRKDW